MTNPPRPPETFATARLDARPPRPEDAAAAFAAYANDVEVTRYLSWRAYDGPEPLRVRFAAQVEAWRTGQGHFAWLLHLRETGELAGSIGVSPDPHGPLLGYVLGRKFWGRGLMAETARFVVDWALGQPEIFRVWAVCDVENPASARVMEKAGMSREGLLRRWHVCPTIGPEPRACLVYARVK
ncbi:MAG TPA: GNAT family protein [Opitutaceae bacterium]|nr:GNAT family protein [Opitutaceae bacterium]